MILDNFKQSHFVIYELVLPYCSVCTPSGDLTESWHTPVTCEESSDEEYSLWFTSNKSPTMSPPSQSIGVKSRLNSKVWRVVNSASETTPSLNISSGMASRGTMSISMSDFDGDPGPINFSDSGTFFGKLKARNVLDGKKIITHYYSMTDENSTPVEVSTSIHYIESSTLSNGTFKLSAKDALKDLEAFSQKFPIPTEARLSADIDNAVVVIPVTDGSLYSAGDVIIIDKELMLVQSILGDDLTVYPRGSTYEATDGVTIYKTEVSDHSLDSTVQICYVMKKTFLSNVLSDVFTDSGLTDYIDSTQWNDEITEWNSNAWLYGVFHTPEDTDKVINHLLTDYMIDMWLDQSTQKAKISATTAWKESIRTLKEGEDLSDLRTSTKANTRYSRAYIYNKKDYQAENDDETNYSQLTIHKDTSTESSDLYGSVKVKSFDPSNFITQDSAFILVSRFVQRFARTPEELSFKMEERKLSSSKLGDIVDVVTRDSQTPSGEFLEARVRCQLTEIKPSFNQVGRVYNVKALSYVPLISSTPGGDLTIFISGTVYDVNLYSRAGAPPDALDITFVFDGATVGSTSESTPSIRAGNFNPSSNIKMIFTNNCKVSAMGGRGGDAFADSWQESQRAEADNGGRGADTYLSDGIATEIYLNYGEVDGFDTSCELYAAGGGGGGAASAISALIATTYGNAALAVSGSGGSGIPSGIAGESSVANGDYNRLPVRINGNNGVSSGREVAEVGNDGIFNGSSSGVSASATRVFDGTTSFYVTASGTGGGGGFSLDGQNGSASTFISWENDTQTVTDEGLKGQEGGAIKGSNVIVYNLLSEAAKFRAGNSDSFTLITE